MLFNTWTPVSNLALSCPAVNNSRWAIMLWGKSHAGIMFEWCVVVILGIQFMHIICALYGDL